jgi:HEAT repeat protein
MTIPEWRNFLQRWTDAWLVRDEKFPRQVRERKWLGSHPAAENQIARLEKQLGYRLPPSYRNFLLTTNGWSRTSVFIKRLLPISKVDWLQTREPELLDIWSPQDDDEPANQNLEEYYSYDGTPVFDRAHLRHSLLIAEPIDGDSMIYVLNPLVVAKDGEWEAWRFANWIPGAERFPSFELLMRAEFELFSNEGKTQDFGPYTGIYAPDQPRHAAPRIGQRRLQPKRSSVPELIAQLESPARATRLKAAKHLLREFSPHDAYNEHPEIVEPLSRILSSDLETDVRSAAAAMLGTYGDTTAIAPLIKALDIPDLTAIAISALLYISIYIADTRVADAMVRLLQTPRTLFETEHAVHILEDLKDARLSAIALHLLDNAPFILPNVEKLPNSPMAEAYHRSSIRFLGAFAFAKMSDSPTNELIKRLTHLDAAVRAAAVAALREDKNRGPHLSSHVMPLLSDPDPIVQLQASTTLQFLEPMPEIEIPPERLAELEAQVATQLNKASRRKSRF